jgi:hypothetical protein
MDAEMYRRRASHCLVVARRINDPHRRAKIIDLAQKWMVFAEQAERQRPVVQQQLQPKQK